MTPDPRLLPVVPVRPSGLAREKPAAAVARSILRSRISLSISEASSSDSIYCGHTAFTRMLSRATASATDLVSAMQAALVTPDGNRSGCGWRRGLPDDVDDAPIFLPPHDWEHSLDHGKKAKHLVAQLPLENIKRRCVDRAAQVSAGIVDQNVDAAERPMRRCHEVLDCRLVGDIGGRPMTQSPIAMPFLPCESSATAARSRSPSRAHIATRNLL